MDKENKYNGWTNYQTWNYKLWLDNSEHTQTIVHQNVKRIFKQAKESKYFSIMDNAANELAIWLLEYVEQNNPIDDASVYADLLDSAISLINFEEIAESYLLELN